MPDKTSLTREKLEATPYGGALLREMDLVIAANYVDYLNRGETLYDAVLAERVSAFCQPLDEGLEECFLGVIPIVTGDGDLVSVAHKTLLNDLATKPRGHWAIYQNGERFDSWMSNGAGGTSTESGQKFTHDRADSPRMNFAEAYASVYSWMVYNRRYQILGEIYHATVAAAGLKPGAKFRDVLYDLKKWNVTYLGSEMTGGTGNARKHLLRMSRRGVKAHEVYRSADDIVRMFRLTHVLPAHYRDPGNPGRLKTLRELRDEAAQSLWDEAINPDATVVDRMRVLKRFEPLVASEFSRFASKAPFSHNDNLLERETYGAGQEREDRPAYIYSVEFEPQSATIKSCGLRAA